jgi:hypothetical protein
VISYSDTNEHWEVIQIWHAHLLLEVTPVFLVNEHQVEVVSCAELLVHITKGRSELETAKEQPYRNGFAYNHENVVRRDVRL